MLRTDTAPASLSPRIGRLGALASFVLAGASVVSAAIYLTGNLNDLAGAFAYDAADFLAGPVWGASLVAAFFALRERISEAAARRSSLALAAAILAAAAMVLVASVRAANRHYHLVHPELGLENSIQVLAVWATLVAGVTGAAWHFLGWALVLIGSASWTSRRLPRALAVVYVLSGITSVFVYARPELEGMAAFYLLIWTIWQGILLLGNSAPKTP